MNTFVTILVEHVEGSDQSSLIPSDGCVRLYPVAPVKDGSLLTNRGVGVQLADGRPVDGGVWVWPGRYVVGAAGRRWEVDIPAGHTVEAPFNLATAVPVDPASPLPWAPTAEDLLLVKETAALIESGEFGGDGPGRPGADGVSVLSILDEDGDGTATVTYSDGRSESLPLPRGLQGEPGEDGADSTVPGPANTLAIGTVTTGAQAAATITGDAPAQTLNLVLPTAQPQDTGWRDITAYLAIPAVTSGRILMRRKDDRVTVFLDTVKVDSSKGEARGGNIPIGFLPVFGRVALPVASDRNQYWGSFEVLGGNPAMVRFNPTHAAIPAYSEVSWTTANPFPDPALWPGTPA